MHERPMKETVFILSSELLVCLLCFNEFSSHDIVLHTKKSVSGSAISNKPARLGTIHQNLKFKAIKQCDFKMDLIKW